MNQDVERLVSIYARKGLLIDTNILLLYYVGYVNRERIARFKRTKQFLPEEYDLLVNFIRTFSKLVTTPNILTEVSNFINQLKEPERSQCYALLAESTEIIQENYVPSLKIVKQGWGFQKYGLTDCSLVSLARDEYLVLTNDLKVADYLQSQNVDTINFNHLRQLSWN